MSAAPSSISRIANPYEPLQEAVVQALKADADIAAKARVYDYVPEDDQGPYVVFSSAWLAEKDAHNQPIDRVWFQIDVWSQYRGYREVNDLGADVEDVLRHATLEVAGFNFLGVHVLREQSHLLREPSNNWRRLAITFHCPYVRMRRTEP